MSTKTFVLAVSLLVAASALAQEEAPVPEGFLRHDLEKGRFRLVAPADWVVEAIELEGSLLWSAAAPDESDDSGASVNLTYSDDLAGTLDQTVEFCLKIARAGYADFEVLERGEVTLAGQTARRLVYLCKDPDYTLRYVHYVLRSGGREYHLEGSTFEEDFARLEPTFRRVFESFRPSP